MQGDLYRVVQLAIPRSLLRGAPFDVRGIFR